MTIYMTGNGLSTLKVVNCPPDKADKWVSHFTTCGFARCRRTTYCFYQIVGWVAMGLTLGTLFNPSYITITVFGRGSLGEPT